MTGFWIRLFSFCITNTGFNRPFGNLGIGIKVSYEVKHSWWSPFQVQLQAWEFQLLLFCREPVSACFWRNEFHSGRYLRSFKNTEGWKLQFVGLYILIRSLLETTSWKFSISFKTRLRNLVRSSFHCKLHAVNPQLRWKGDFSSYFLEHTMHFLTELQNAGFCYFTKKWFHHRGSHSNFYNSWNKQTKEAFAVELVFGIVICG